ncbi:transposase [Crystallibacter degradans]|uniref:transposase n=1 Tax=Crystallibacter degradans TaxID=2726743 RepID=UPI003F82EB08
MQWRLGVRVVAIDLTATFHKTFQMLLLRTAVAVDYFHLVALGNSILIEVRQRLTQETKRRRRATDPDPAWASRMLLKADESSRTERGTGCRSSSTSTRPAESCKRPVRSRNNCGVRCEPPHSPTPLPRKTSCPDSSSVPASRRRTGFGARSSADGTRSKS